VDARSPSGNIRAGYAAPYAHRSPADSLTGVLDSRTVHPFQEAISALLLASHDTWSGTASDAGAVPDSPSS